MNANCPRCQKETQTQDKFCGGCGYDLQEVATAPVAGTQLDIKVSDVQLSLAMVYFKNEKYDQCADLLRKVLAQDPDNLNAHALLDRVRANRVEHQTVSQPTFEKE